MPPAKRMNTVENMIFTSEMSASQPVSTGITREAAALEVDIQPDEGIRASIVNMFRVNHAALVGLIVILLIVVAAVFVLYQFVTADLQPFIYFQF